MFVNMPVFYIVQFVYLGTSARYLDVYCVKYPLLAQVSYVRGERKKYVKTK